MPRKPSQRVQPTKIEKPEETITDVNEVEDEVEDEVEGDDSTSQIFDVMRESIDMLQDKFNIFFEKPDRDKFIEFEMITMDYIMLVRSLKNIAKSLLPQTDKPTIKSRQRKIKEKIEQKIEQLCTQIDVQHPVQHPVQQ